MRKVLTLMVLLAASSASAQALTPLQQYLYNESGYAPPELAAQPAPVAVAPTPYATAYAPRVTSTTTVTQGVVQTKNTTSGYAQEGQGEGVGPSGDSASLRSLLTSAGN